MLLSTWPRGWLIVAEHPATFVQHWHVLEASLHCASLSAYRIHSARLPKRPSCESHHTATVGRGHALQDIVSWQTKKDRTLVQSLNTLPGTTITSRRRNWKRLENCPKSVLGQNWYTLWSVNKLARAVTKWTGACDRRLALLISYIHHT